MKGKRLSNAEIVVILLIVTISLAFLTGQAVEVRHGSRRYACVENLKQLALALNLYSNENQYLYPPIEDAQNNFIFDANLMYPEYLSDTMLPVCPVDPRRDPDTNFRLTEDHSVDGTLKGEVHPDCFTGDSYIYLGWMVMTDKESEAFFEAYDKFSADEYDADITVPKGWGTLEGDTIHRLSAGVDRFLIHDINAAMAEREVGASIVPIMWDRPYANSEKFSHQPTGSNVLYLDGHVEYFRFESGYSPINEIMARLLEERPREPIPHCE